MQFKETTRIYNIVPGAIFLALIVVLGVVSLEAAPSGGPYGPIQKTYDKPDVEGTIYYVAPDGDAGVNGKILEKPTTIESAIERVKTGDAIVLRGGIYRTGDLVLNQGITMQPYANEQPLFKGTHVAEEWEDLGDGLWVTSWDRLFPSAPQGWWRRHRELRKTPLHRFNNDMVFADGEFLQSVGWAGNVDENTYFIDYETKEVYIGVDPAEHQIEITAYNLALRRTTEKVHGKKPDHRGPVIRGITFSQYAYRAFEIEGTEPQGPADESEFGKDVVGTTLEHLTISYCSRVAGYFRGDSLTIRHCKVSDTSTEGIYILASNDVLLEKNIFTRNNIERITGYYPAAVKIFNQSHRVTCRDNLVIDHPYSNGIWYDVGNVDGVFINNWVQGVGNTNKPVATDRLWPSDNGFFFEISKGVTVAGNVFVDCDHGVMILNSSDAKIYQNTFVNSMVCIGRDNRSAEGDHFGWHPATGPGVEERDGHIFVNNLLTGKDFNRPLLFTWQPSFMCDRLSKSPLNKMNHNIYVKDDSKIDAPVILWSPVDNQECQAAFQSLEEFQEIYSEFSTNNQLYDDYAGPLFKGSELGNYQLLQGFPGEYSGTELPDAVKSLLEYQSASPTPGAYPTLSEESQ
ncbi:MAG: right-handed parallel beta-helix repeat-containing protein [Candidatus Marinimicrobia bacterium]|nr:right-handed parallel beta-helix repeat-containing protein [Candidatus Neomarinimicrobiota bacterium]MCF7880612.1 right-handed parallel beta-helix repeat-containing protein [Candidatus Neomarinimicrobiota bacterium]